MLSNITLFSLSITFPQVKPNQFKASMAFLFGSTMVGIGYWSYNNFMRGYINQRFREDARAVARREKGMEGTIFG